MAFLFSAAYLSKKYNQKILFGIIYTLPSMIGTIVFISESRVSSYPESRLIISPAVPTRSDTKVGLLISF